MQTYQIEYVGKWPSSNIIYRLNHRQRHKLELEYKEVFTNLIEQQKLPSIDKFRIHLEYRSRLDADNTVPGLKVFVDTLRALSIVTQDTSKHYCGLSITPNHKLPANNTYLIKLEVLG